jgi:hypothetical protein
MARERNPSLRRIARDIRADIRVAKKLRLKWWELLVLFVCTLFTGWIFDSFGHLELTLSLLNSVLVLAVIIAIKVDLRRKPWFWIFMAFAAALHVVLLLTIPWTTKWIPAAAIAGIDSIDLFGILAGLSIISNLHLGSAGGPKR